MSKFKLNVSTNELSSLVSVCPIWDGDGIVVITTAQHHSAKPKPRPCADSNPACGASEIWDGEDLWKGSQLERRLKGRD